MQEFAGRLTALCCTHQQAFSSQFIKSLMKTKTRTFWKPIRIAGGWGFLLSTNICFGRSCKQVEKGSGQWKLGEKNERQICSGLGIIWQSILNLGCPKEVLHSWGLTGTFLAAVSSLQAFENKWFLLKHIPIHQWAVLETSLHHFILRIHVETVRLLLTYISLGPLRLRKLCNS
mgnify:CR=1 FL=1